MRNVLFPAGNIVILNPHSPSDNLNKVDLFHFIQWNLGSISAALSGSVLEKRLVVEPKWDFSNLSIPTSIET